MRIYEVEFDHIQYGRRWSSETVAVRGFVQMAIKKALSLQNGQAKSLRVVQVTLVAEGK